MSQGRYIQASIYPGYNATSGEFRLGSQPSGAAGAKVKLTLSLNNAPQILYGLRSVVTYELPDEFFSRNYDFKRQMAQGHVDSDMLMRVNLTQQNITQEATHLRTIVGSDGFNWHPLPSPYLFQGGNNVIVESERLSSYPTLRWSINDVEFTAQVFPTVHITLVINEFVGGRQPTPIRAAP